MKKYNLVLFGVKETTAILAEYLHRQGIKIDLLISIDSSILQHTDVANYTSLESTAKKLAADYYCVSDYSLKKCADNFFEQHEFNTGIVYGWQRLIPDHVLNKFQIGVFGFHASPDLLPKGRGRSPLNWSLILGKTTLYNHCFKYVAGADAGDVHSVTQFSINAHDTILTLMYKSLLTAKKQVIHLIEDICTDNLKLTHQSGEPYFFPKRTSEDGFIDFNYRSTQEIVNLIRGVTKPFSGAFCFTDRGEKITVWEAWPFDKLLDFSEYQPGEVVDTLYNMPVIKTIDGSIILKLYEGGVLKEHDCLTNKIVEGSNKC